MKKRDRQHCFSYDSNFLFLKPTCDLVFSEIVCKPLARYAAKRANHCIYNCKTTSTITAEGFFFLHLPFAPPPGDAGAE